MKGSSERGAGGPVASLKTPILDPFDKHNTNRRTTMSRQEQKSATQGRIDAEEAAWLRRMLFADGMIDDEERKFLHELNGEAKQVGREFEQLFEECMKQPQEQHTCG
jgi:uncharacterized membrane protein YebE (DUF533 family)